MDIGAEGRSSDGGVYAVCAITDNTLQLPEVGCPPRSTTPLPFALVGDEAFPLRSFYCGHILDIEWVLMRYENTTCCA